MISKISLVLKRELQMNREGQSKCAHTVSHKVSYACGSQTRTNTLHHRFGLLGCHRLATRVSSPPSGVHTVRCTPCKWPKHPRRNLLEHPRTQFGEHRFGPRPCTGRVHVGFDILISHTSYESFVAFNEAKCIKCLPHCSVLWVRGLGHSAQKRRGNQRFDATCKSGRENGKQMGLERQGVSGDDGLS